MSKRILIVEDEESIADLEKDYLELGVMCKIAEGLGICVHELRADEESYAVSVPKDTLAKLIVVSEINGVELEEGGRK